MIKSERERRSESKMSSPGDQIVITDVEAGMRQHFSV